MLKPLLFFIFIYEIALGDWISTTSRISAYLLSSECSQKSCMSPLSNPSLNQTLACLDYASTNEFFKEIAKEQKDEMTCEFDFLSQYDHRGFDDWRSSCNRYGSLFSVQKDFRVAFENMSSDPIKPKAEVTALQFSAVNQILDAVSFACQTKKFFSQLSSDYSRSNCNEAQDHFSQAKSYTPPSSPRCLQLQSLMNQQKQDLELAHLRSWNGSNPFVKKYFDNISDQIGSDCQKLASSHKWRNEFIKSALNAASSNSFQRLVIERGKTLACHTMEFMKKIEQNPNVFNSADRSSEFRDYRGYLTALGLAKMATQPEFKKKYDHIRCDLNLDYGTYAQYVTNGAQVTLALAALLQPYVSRAVGGVIMAGTNGSTLLRIGHSAQIVAGTLAAIGVQVSNIAVNLMAQCGSGAPELSRQNICAHQQMKDLPPDAFVNSQYHENLSTNCSIGIAIETASLGALGRTLGNLQEMTSFRLSPKDVVRKYKTFSRIGAKENLQFIKEASQYRNKKMFFDIENMVLKELNDKAFKNKRLGSVVTNLHKTALMQAIDRNAKLRGHIHAYYSDFKSIRLIIDDDPELISELNKIFVDVQTQFSSLLQHPEFLKLLDNPELREFVKTPSSWFRGGVGRSADEAGVASRNARKMDGATYNLLNYSNDDLQKVLSGTLANIRLSAEAFQDSKYKAWVDRGVLTVTQKGKVPSVDLVSIIRKQSLPHRDLGEIKRGIIESVKKQMGVTMSDQEVDRIYQLYQEADRFSPGIFVSERVTLHLEEATHGYIVGDFMDLGSRNTSTLMKELANSSTVDDAVARARQSEVQVTTILNQQKEELIQLQKSKGDEFLEIRFTGDDSVMMKNPLSQKSVSENDLRDYVKKSPSSIRATAVSPKTADGKTFDFHNFDSVTVKAEEFQKELVFKLNQELGINQRKKFKLGVFVNPPSKYSESSPLKNAKLSLFVTNTEPVDRAALSKIKEIAEKLATQYELSELSVRDF